jgi:hypothetical protein
MLLHILKYIIYMKRLEYSFILIMTFTNAIILYKEKSGGGCIITFTRKLLYKMRW